MKLPANHTSNKIIIIIQIINQYLVEHNLIFIKIDDAPGH